MTSYSLVPSDFYTLAKVDFSPIDKIRRRVSIFKLEECLLAMAQASMPLEHYFCDGLYARKLTIPMHCCLTGAIHKRANIAILAAGEMTIVTEDGVKRISAHASPYVIVSREGIKRAGFAHEDCVFITVHSCKSQSVADVEEELFTNRYADYEAWLQDQQCQQLSRQQ